MTFWLWNTLGGLKTLGSPCHEGFLRITRPLDRKSPARAVIPKHPHRVGQQPALNGRHYACRLRFAESASQLSSTRVPRSWNRV